jgi:hypothetical protein
MHEDDKVIDSRADLIAQSLSDSLRQIAGSDLCAVWLYGASVFGHPFVDIDLHILLQRQLSDIAWESVRAAHTRLGESAGLPPEDLDFWYITVDDARSHRNPVHLSPWAAGLTDTHWALHRAHWLAGRLNVIYGPGPSNIVLPPEWHDIEIALRKELTNPQPSAYWVLQLCRVWASLLTRDVVRSKLDSGRWALERLPKDYQALVRAAMRYYEHLSFPEDQSMIRDGFFGFLRKIRELVG